MSLKLKKKEFKFTFKVFFRLLIFCIIVFIVLSYLSTNTSDKKIVLPQIPVVDQINLNIIYNSLPKESQEKINQINSATNSAIIQEKVNYYKNELSGFPEKQIKDIQVEIVNRVYRDIINNIEKK